jgi:hypothetical protein
VVDANAAGALVLLGVLVLGVLAGRAEGRVGLLLGGLLVIAGWASWPRGGRGRPAGAPPDVLGPRLAAVYAVVVPPAGRLPGRVDRRADQLVRSRGGGRGGRARPGRAALRRAGRRDGRGPHRLTGPVAHAPSTAARRADGRDGAG